MDLNKQTPGKKLKATADLIQRPGLEVKFGLPVLHTTNFLLNFTFPFHRDLKSFLHIHVLFHIYDVDIWNSTLYNNKTCYFSGLYAPFHNPIFNCPLPRPAWPQNCLTEINCN